MTSSDVECASVKEEQLNATKAHWTERGRAASAGHLDVVGRPTSVSSMFSPCQYTGAVLRPDKGSLDRGMPRPRGGPGRREYLVCAAKSVNPRKRSRLRNMPA